MEGVEGNFAPANTPFPLVITRSFGTSGTVVVTYSTADGSALANVDYLPAQNATVTFAPGEVTKTVFVQVMQETVAEYDETFTVTITSVSAGTISSATATATILSDDPVDNFPGIEGDIVDAQGGPGGDGLILANDVTAIRMFILGLATPSGTQFQRADVNAPCGNGQLDAGDVTIIRQMILGTIPNNMLACGPTAAARAKRIDLISLSLPAPVKIF